ncbi:unnamed protein product [Lactuca virosa]|uniref:Uncharacterized protein n=1 Tax=Lactuca virosa TaxID=75947 RepID=A0AAU9M2R7_9ASTR|nr:unnamed protein product [Lactuca virosa]
MVNDAVDFALDTDDMEDEIEEEVDKVLTSIAGEIAAQLPEAARKGQLKEPATLAQVKIQELQPSRFNLVHPSAMRYTSDDEMKFFNPTTILKEVQSKPPVSDSFPNYFPAKRNLAARFR